MKITFTGTEKEKETFMDDLMDSDFCPFSSCSTYCAKYDMCSDCLKENIEWKIVEG